jgi:hypothetical protein
MRFTQRAASGCVIACGVFAAAAAQEQTFRTAVIVQTVDVIAVDRAGHPVQDLTSSEFSARVGGRVRRVATAELLKGPQDPAAAAPSLDVSRSSAVANSPVSGDTAPLPWIVMFFDDESFAFGEGELLTRGVADFIKGTGRAAHYAVASVSSWGELYLSDNATDVATRVMSLHGRETSLRSVDLATFPGIGSIGVLESLSAFEQGNERVKHEAASRACIQVCEGTQPGNECVACQAAAESAMHAIAISAGDRATRQMRSIAAALALLARQAGPKHVILVSRGIPMLEMNFPGSELARLSAAAGAIIHVLYDERLIDMSRASAPSGAQRDDTAAAHSILESVSSATGGSFHQVAGNPRAILESIAAEMRGVYRVGIELEPSDLAGDNLELKVDTSRRGVVVRGARRLIPTVRSGPKPTVEQRLTALLAGRVADQSLPIALRTHVARDENGGGLRLTIATHIDAEGPVQSAYALFTATGQRVSAGTARDRRAAAGNGIDIGASEAVPPGDYVVRLAAVDDRDRGGAIEHRFRARLNIAGDVAFSDPVIWSASSGDVPMLSADDRIETSEAMKAQVEFYAAGREGVAPFAVRFELCALDDGHVLSTDTRRVQVVGDQPLAVRALLNVASLESGNYEFRVTIDDREPQGRRVWSRQLRLVRRPATAPTIVASPSDTGVNEPISRTRAVTPVLNVQARALASAFSIERALPTAIVDRIVGQLARRTGGFTGALATRAEHVRRGEPAAVSDDPAPIGRSERLQWGILSAISALRAGNPDQASARVRQALAAAPDFTPAIYILGIAEAARGHDAEAANAWIMATGLPNVDPAVYTQAIDSLIRTGRFAEAATLATEARAKWPDDATVLDREIVVAGALQRADAVETLTRRATNSSARLLRIASLHDLALATPPQSPAWRTFITEADAFIAEQSEGVDLVRLWLKDAVR